MVTSVTSAQVLGTAPLDSAPGTALPGGEGPSTAKLRMLLKFPSSLEWTRGRFLENPNADDGHISVLWVDQDAPGVCVAEVC